MYNFAKKSGKGGSPSTPTPPPLTVPTPMLITVIG